MVTYAMRHAGFLWIGDIRRDVLHAGNRVKARDILFIRCGIQWERGGISRPVAYRLAK